jgi:isopenicillin-N epimerase
VPNATTGVNLVARSLPLQPGDEILTTDHEYGACRNTWQFICEHTGAQYVERPMLPPFTSEEAFVEQFWAGVTTRTRVIYLSHITSPTALIFPIAEIIRRAREAGILTLIDGAHTPGHIPVDLRALDADFYTGNCHKWLCTPKGSAFLYVRREHQSFIQPAIISWGYGLAFKYLHQMQGTRDPAAYLAVPAALDFLREHHWDEVRARCHALAAQTANELTRRSGLEPLSDEAWFGQMVAIPLPSCDDQEVKRRLYDDYCIEVPVFTWNNAQYVRVSIQGYNTPSDADRLLAALDEILNGI